MEVRQNHQYGVWVPDVGICDRQGGVIALSYAKATWFCHRNWTRIRAIITGCSMGTSLSPRTVLLTMTFIIASLICQAALYVAHLLQA
jgi:hypothetical protein